jgi:nucleoside-diphosphate-sugar epimerase
MAIKEILVTGGAGYVGSAVVEGLLYRYPDSKIIVLDNLSKGKFEFVGPLFLNNKERIEIIKADLRDEKVIEDVFQKHRFDTVIHLAAIVDAFTTNRPGKDLECKQVNYEATITLANLAKKYGVVNFLYQSSVSVYSTGENLKEEDEKSPISAYGQYKLFGEKILELVDNKFKIVVIRPATIFGYSPGFRYETVINLFAVRAFYGMPLPVFREALDNDKSYLGVQDNVRAIFYCLENIDVFNGHIFNVVSFNTNLREILRVLEGIYGKLNVKIIDSANVSQQVYTISGNKFYNRGFKPTSNLKEEMMKVKNYLENYKRMIEARG